MAALVVLPGSSVIARSSALAASFSSLAAPSRAKVVLFSRSDLAPLAMARSLSQVAASAFSAMMRSQTLRSGPSSADGLVASAAKRLFASATTALSPMPPSVDTRAERNTGTWGFSPGLASNPTLASTGLSFFDA